jgi:hypothetical protein
MDAPTGTADSGRSGGGVSELTLWTSGLLSKWGFNDGDMPDDVWDAWDEVCRPASYRHVDWHPVLCRLVSEYVAPRLDQRVELTEIGTNHNPIRASKVDGVDVEDCWYGKRPEPTISPESVTVPMSDVLAMLGEATA